MKIGRQLRNVSVACGLVYVPMFVIHAVCITGWGMWSIAGVEIFVMAPLLAFGVGLVAAPLALLPSRRSAATSVLVVVAALIVLFVPVVFLSHHLRMLGFSLASERAEPLVQAVHRWVDDHGAPPESLETLVPGYLPRLPGHLPPMRLVTGDEARRSFAGNPWALCARVPSGIINFDRFLYLPGQDYPEYGFGGWLQRLGAWAYVHE